MAEPRQREATHDRGSEAGVYEYFLGGHELPTELDVAIAEVAIQSAPETVLAAKENRSFVRRAAHRLVELGVRQFLDLGCGYPTHGPLHEAVLAAAPDARVAYVDYDPAVAAYARDHVDVSDSQVRWITANLRRPWDIADHPDLRAIIDLDAEPTAVVMAAVLHFVPDQAGPGGAGAHEIVEWWRDRVAPDSYIVLSHGVSGHDPEGAERAAAAWERSRSQMVIRTPDEVDALLIGCELLPPGLVTTTEWGTSLPAPTDGAVLLAAVGRVT